MLLHNRSTRAITIPASIVQSPDKLLNCFQIIRLFSLANQDMLIFGNEAAKIVKNCCIKDSQHFSSVKKLNF